jgi:outer membrane protein assembly factor BamE
MKPYTLDIQQGVVVEQSMIDKLKPGMTRSQVGLVLGTPLLTDVMHADRWDYVFYTRRDNKVGEWRRFSVHFKEDRLDTLTGDVALSGGKVSTPATLEPGLPSSGLPEPLPGSQK